MHRPIDLTSEILHEVQELTRVAVHPIGRGDVRTDIGIINDVTIFVLIRLGNDGGQ